MSECLLFEFFVLTNREIKCFGDAYRRCSPRMHIRRAEAAAAFLLCRHVTLAGDASARPISPPLDSRLPFGLPRGFRLRRRYLPRQLSEPRVIAAGHTFISLRHLMGDTSAPPEASRLRCRPASSRD